MSLEYNNIYIADFETSLVSKNTIRDGVHVYAYGFVDLNGDNLTIGYNIYDFMETVKNFKKSSTIYFHNLKYDGSYIINYLLKNGFKHSQSKHLKDHEFSTLITDQGQWFSVKVKIGKKTFTFLDSLKKLVLSVSNLAKAYGLDIQKLDYDYGYYPVGYIISGDEVEYLKHDLYIVQRVMKIMYDNKYLKMTSSGDALQDFKERITFDEYFPPLSSDIDDFCRNSYAGGISYLSPHYTKKFTHGYYYDVNSMYPSRMKDCLLPYGIPVFFKGSPKQMVLDQFPLYIVKVVIDCTLKENHIPCLQDKKSYRNHGGSFITETEGNEVFTLTNVDIDTLYMSYNVYYFEIVEGYYFKGATGFFDDYINYWYDKKSNAKTDGESAVAKLRLNGLYGKFGASPINRIKIPYLDHDEILRFETITGEDKETIYVPMASFITAYSRQLLIKNGNLFKDKFIYCDTDSIQVATDEIPQGFDIDPKRLGAFKLEGKFNKGLYHKQKTYGLLFQKFNHKTKSFEEEKPKITGAGLSADTVDIEEFWRGGTFTVKKGGQVKGGQFIFDDKKYSLELTNLFLEEEIQEDIEYTII